MFGEPAKDLTDTTWTERGKALEPDARRYYSFHTDTDARTVGFCVRDDGIAGASPDGLVNPGRPRGRRLLELKCPREDTHMLYLARGVLPSEYRAQVQGQLWVTGRAWADFMSYCPELPPFLIRVEPDPKFQAALDDHMPVFWAELMAGRQRLIEKGVTPWQK